MAIFLKRNSSDSASVLSSSLLEIIRKGSWDQWIVVVPTNRKIRDLHRLLLNNTHHTFSPLPHLFTLELLARQMATTCCPPKRLVSTPLQAVLLQEAVRLAHRQSGLQYFAASAPDRSVRLSPGTFQKLLEVITSLKETGIYPETLRKELSELEETRPNGTDEHAKLKDVISIYEAYETMLGDEFVDVGGVYKDLNEGLTAVTAEGILRENSPRAQFLVVNGFDEFSSPELRMISSLSSVRSISSLVAFDCNPENKELFGHLIENYKVLLQMGFETITDDTPLRNMWLFNRPQDEELAETLTRHLFQSPGQSTRLPRQEKITLFSAKDRKEEVRLIARSIKSWMLDHPDQDLGRICVATYQTPSYTPYIRELFADYGIPVNVTDRFYLSHSPVVLAVLSLVDVVKNNFRRKDVLRVLGSPYLRFRYQGGEVDSSNLHTIATQLKLTFDAQRWMDRIEKRISALDVMGSDLDGEREEENLERERASLRKGLEDVRWFSSILRPLQQTMTPADFKRSLTQLLGTFKITDQLFRFDPRIWPTSSLEQEVKGFDRLHCLLDELVEYLSLQGLSSTELSIDFYAEQLRTAVQQLRYNVRERAGYGVLVTSLEETRGIDFDLMFIAGLVDGEFPISYQPEVFLSQARQQANERYHLTENRYLFYQGIRNFSKYLFVSYPIRDGDFELVPSTFVDALLQLVDVEDARGTYGERFQHSLLSKPELLEAASTDPTVSSRSLPDEVQNELRFVALAQNVERSRSIDHALPEYEGLIGGELSDEARKALAGFRDRTFSVSQLETYGKCPFKFFAERVLRLNVVEEPEEGLSPLEKGLVLHKSLFDFYRDRRERGLPLLSACSEQEFADAVSALETIVWRHLEKIEIEDVFWQIEREELLGSPGGGGMIERLLRYERTRSLSVRPAYFELSFGRYGRSVQDADPLIRHDQPIQIGAVQYRGRVDRVEKDERVFSIIDYKTGSSVPSPRDMQLGMSLQLPLYLVAVEQLLLEHEQKPFKGVAGLYYMLSEDVAEKVALGVKDFKGKAFHVPASKRPHLCSEQELHDMIRVAVAFSDSYVNAIARGEFSLTSEEKVKKVCRVCDYSTICRIQTREWVERRSER